MELNLTSEIILLYFAISCHAFDQFIDLELTPIWRNYLTYTRGGQTVFLDIDDESSVIFKQNILKSIHQHEHSVISISRAYVPEPKFSEKLKTVLKPYNNFVFTTKYLSSVVLDDPLLVDMLKSYWSPLFIIVTTEDSMYNCDNGKFNEEAANTIETFLNDLWYKHRIIHVFLNLPYVCPNEYVIYNGTKPSYGELYNRTITLIQTGEQLGQTMTRRVETMLTQNYPLRGNIFYRFPTAIENCSGTDIYIKTTQKDSGGFCGMDGLVMTDIVRYFGFNLTIPTLAPGSNKYGYQQPDGIITGSLGHIVMNNVDISFNSRFMVPYTTGIQQYVFLHHVAVDSLCVILNQPEEEPLWQYPVNAYSLPQWLFILVCLTAFGMLMWIFARIENKMHKTKEATLVFYVLNSLNAGLFGFFLKQRNNLLLLRVACLLISVSVLAEYQSYINYIFTTRVRYDMLNSQADLAGSNIKIVTSPSIFNLINESINEVGEILKSRAIVRDDWDAFEYVAHHKDAATLERKTDAILLTLMQYTDEDGRPLLYVMDDGLRVFYLSYIASLEFPFVTEIRTFMMRLVESGLAKMYYMWTSRALDLEVKLPNLHSEPRPAGMIGMGEEIIAFSVLFVGHVLSVVVFVLEIWVARRRKYPFVH